MRSKGSLCSPGSNPARWPCSISIANSLNTRRSTRPPNSAAKASAPGSFPRRTLVAISQAEAALTNTSVSKEERMDRAFLESFASSMAHQIRACVSMRTRRPLFPCGQFFGRQRLEERGAEFKFSLEYAELPLFRWRLNRNQAHYRLLPPGNHDLFTAFGLCDKARKVCFGLMDCSERHTC